MFDPGATHSFISSAFPYKLNQVSEPLVFQLVVSTPIGGKIIVSTKYVNCEVMIGEMETSIDLIKLDEMEFDAILGMTGCLLVVHTWIVIGRGSSLEWKELWSLFLKG